MSVSQPPAPARRRYLVVFLALAVLTVLEVAVAHPSLGVPRAPRVAALGGLALAKASGVALFFMHLWWERPALRWMVAAPMLFPVVFALALLADASWRLLP
jgi:caa(3)-type oxidase subunit IV